MNEGTGVALVGAFVIACIVGVIALFGVFGALEKTNGGEYAVVRNGGLFDNNKVRQVIDPASSVTYAGMWSHVHKYPAAQRFYTITSNEDEGDKKQADVVTTPTSDGVNVGIEGTIYFTLNSDHATLTDFDNKFGTRRFNGKHVFDGDEGFRNFLNVIIRPVIDNDLREQIGSFSCGQLVSSCALIQSQGNAVKLTARAGQKNNSNIQQIQQAINTSLTEDLNRTLGGDYLTNIRFNLVKVTLPDKVQNAVDDAQAAFGRVSQSEARVKSARQDAKANRVRERGYRYCPTCAEIDARRAIPSGVQVWAPGSGGGISVGVGR